MPTRIEMVPDDKPGHKTIIVYSSGAFDEPLDGRFFSYKTSKLFANIRTK